MVFSLHNSQSSSECTIFFLRKHRLCLLISFYQSIWGKLMSHHHREERLLFPGLLEGLWGSQLQSRAKMEPGDYLRVSIILVPLILSCRELENWLCQDEADTHHRSYTAVNLLVRSFSYFPLIFLFLQCFWCAFNSKFWQRKGLTSAVPNAIFTWLSKNAAICPQA